MTINHSTETSAETPDDRKRRLARERQARYAARVSTGTTSPTGTRRNAPKSAGVDLTLRTALDRLLVRRDKARAALDQIEADVAAHEDALLTLGSPDAAPDASIADAIPDARVLTLTPDADATVRADAPPPVDPSNLPRVFPALTVGLVAGYKMKNVSRELTASIIGCDITRNHPSTRAWVDSVWNEL